jgi:hypothetical protein
MAVTLYQLTRDYDLSRDMIQNGEKADYFLYKGFEVEILCRDKDHALVRPWDHEPYFEAWILRCFLEGVPDVPVPPDTAFARLGRVVWED